MNILKLLAISATFAIVACGDAPAPDAPAAPAAPVVDAAPAAPMADTATAPMTDTAAAPMADTAAAPMTDTAAAPMTDTAAAPMADTAAAPVAAAPAEMVGIATCDDYLKQYEACVAGISPESQAAMKMGLDTVRGQWLAMAKNDQQKAGLEMACKAALDQFPAMKTQYGCK
jgi:hypothetical protein